MQAEQQSVLKCLDSMALSLADHGHHWTTEQRQAYEASVAYLTTGDCKETGLSASD